MNLDIVYLVKYKYLYMLMTASKKLKKSSDKEDIRMAEKLDERYKTEYKKSISGIQGAKRRLRLGLYRWFKISV